MDWKCREEHYHNVGGNPRRSFKEIKRAYYKRIISHESDPDKPIYINPLNRGCRRKILYPDVSHEGGSRGVLLGLYIVV